MQSSKYIFLTFGAIALSSCGSLGPEEFAPNASGPSRPTAPAAVEPISDTPVLIGAPYTIDGTTYTPEDVTSYDEVGYASWFGSELDGRPTTNGEIFSATATSAAHKTLPLPTYVEVTALETGRTILVRINERGPAVNNRLIDLSEAAAQQLGISGQEVAGVRVRKVNPPNPERAILRNGGQAIRRIDTPESLTRILRDRLAKLPVPQGRIRIAASPSPNASIGNNGVGGRFISEGQRNPPQAAGREGRFVVETNDPKAQNKPAAISGYVVQLSSFSLKSRADALARKVGGNVAPSGDGSLFRVRYGPYATKEEAQQGLANAQQRGYPQARIFRE